MAKMSEAQRNAILRAHDERGSVRGRRVTLHILAANGWGRVDEISRGTHPTPAGLIAAGVDMEAIHAEALESPEHQQHRNVLHEQRALFRDQDHAEAMADLWCPGCRMRCSHHPSEDLTMPQHPTTLKKAELVRIALGLKLGLSKSALEAHRRGDLLRMVLDALNNPTPRGDQP